MAKKNPRRTKITVDFILRISDKGTKDKEKFMIIVRDIQDAMTMKKKLSSLVRRSVNQSKAQKDILVELMMIIEDLDKNIEREERANEIEFERLMEA